MTLSSSPHKFRAERRPAGRGARLAVVMAGLATPDALITTDASRGVLRFSQVVTEPDGAALSLITVTSCCNQPLRVHLESTAGASSKGLVTFQLENANLRQGYLDDDDPDDWNALFNECSQIDAIDLEPYGQQTLVVSFRPQHSDAESGDAHSQSKRPFGEPTALRERHAIQEVRTSIQLRPVVLGPSAVAAPPPEQQQQQQQQQQQPLSVTPIKAAAARTAKEETGGSIMAVAAAPLTPAAAVATGPARGDANGGDAPVPSGVAPPTPIKLLLLARVCISRLRTDHHELAFDCIIGTTAVKDFTVWNCSEVPLRFRLSLNPRGPPVPRCAPGPSQSKAAARERGRAQAHVSATQPRVLSAAPPHVLTARAPCPAHGSPTCAAAQRGVHATRCAALHAALTLLSSAPVRRVTPAGGRAPRSPFSTPTALCRSPTRGMLCSHTPTRACEPTSSRARPGSMRCRWP